MANSHEILKIKVMQDWSRAHRGRLFIMNQGLAVPVHSKNPMWFGPFPNRKKGFPDLFGYEYDKDGVPVFSTVEIKTSGDRLRPGQKNIMTILTAAGCRCYVCKGTEGDYKETRWTETELKGDY